MREVMDRCGINSVGKKTCGINWSVTKIGNTRQQRMSVTEKSESIGKVSNGILFVCDGVAINMQKKEDSNGFRNEGMHEEEACVKGMRDKGMWNKGS